MYVSNHAAWAAWRQHALESATGHIRNGGPGGGDSLGTLMTRRALRYVRTYNVHTPVSASRVVQQPRQVGGQPADMFIRDGRRHCAAGALCTAGIMMMG